LTLRLGDSATSQGPSLPSRSGASCIHGWEADSTLAVSHPPGLHRRLHSHIAISSILHTTVHGPRFSVAVAFRHGKRLLVGMAVGRRTTLRKPKLQMHPWAWKANVRGVLSKLFGYMSWRLYSIHVHGYYCVSSTREFFSSVPLSLLHRMAPLPLFSCLCISRAFSAHDERPPSLW
jgi:hypothetical protein